MSEPNQTTAKSPETSAKKGGKKASAKPAPLPVAKPAPPKTKAPIGAYAEVVFKNGNVITVTVDLAQNYRKKGKVQEVRPVSNG